MKILWLGQYSYSHIDYAKHNIDNINFAIVILIFNVNILCSINEQTINNYAFMSIAKSKILKYYTALQKKKFF